MAPGVRLSVLEIVFTRVLSFECFFNALTSSRVQSRRIARFFFQTAVVTISLFDFWRCIFVTLPKRQTKVQCRVRQGPGGILGVTLDQSAQRAEHWDTLALQLEYPKPLQFITTAMTF